MSDNKAEDRKTTDEPLQRAPIDLLNFVGKENENFMVSLVGARTDVNIAQRIQGLYVPALKNVKIRPQDETIYHLLTFTHYHFLYSIATLMRCHFSEAFASVRAAIDGALVAAWIIHDRNSREAYKQRRHPFDKLIRHLKNFIRDNKTLPNAQIPTLIELHGKMSEFASHADSQSFIYRLREPVAAEADKLSTGYEYFQFSRNEDERQLHSFYLFLTFTTILEVFADYLIVERTAVPEEWRTQLHNLAKHMYVDAGKLEKKLGLVPDSPPPV